MKALAGLEGLRATLNPWPLQGLVERVTGLVVESRGPRGSLGDACLIERDEDAGAIEAELIGFRRGSTLLMPLGDLTGVRPGDRVRLSPRPPDVPTGELLLGRVIDALGRPLDGRGPLAADGRAPLLRSAPPALDRPRIDRILATGVRSIDALLTCGCGQRLGIFAGAGVGKSILLGMIARHSSADVNVIGLIGERGREVREFIERDLGPEGLARSVVVVVTGDQAPLLKRRGVQMATALAESFRDRGRDVLLLVDSLTRVAMAQREIGLSAGEPPTSKGYTPSVFTLLPGLLERAGRSGTGSITAFYTVLVDGDDLSDPVPDAARSILDGHIVLSRKLADRGHYPAVDPLASVSRVMSDLAGAEHRRAASRLGAWLAAYDEAEDLVQIGAYAKGSDAMVDEALSRLPAIRAFMQQGKEDWSPLPETLRALQELCA
jgi:flagellum-specific ATP synthase